MPFREGHLLKQVANATTSNLLLYFMALARPVVRSEQNFTDAAFVVFFAGTPSVVDSSEIRTHLQKINTF